MDGPLLLIDRTVGRGVVRQLVDGLRRGILDGALRAGDPVPSTRALAGELGVARSSVVAAYEQLAGEGYLELRQGAATRVAALDAPGGPDQMVVAPENRGEKSPGEKVLLDSGQDAPPRILAQGRNAAHGGPAHDGQTRHAADAVAVATPAGSIDLSPGVPSTARLDERAWRAAWRGVGTSPPPSTSPPPFGLPELRTAIAEHLRHARGVACSPDDVVVTAGTSEALALTGLGLRAIAGSSPRVGVEDPGYAGGRRALQLHGAELVPLPLAAGGLDVTALAGAGALDAVMVTPSHQYPLGGRLPVSERLALLDWARTTDAIVVEDDYDSEFRHTGAPLPALASLDRGERVVLVGSFSKVLTPWLRLGYLVLPRHPGLRAAVTAARTDLDSPVAGPVQLAMARLLTSGALRRHIAATRREYRHRRALVQDALAPLERLGAGLRALEGGLHAVLELPDAAAEARLVARLEEEGVVVAPLGMYAVGATGPDEARPAGIVIGYAGVGDLALSTALARIAALARIVLADGDGPAVLHTRDGGRNGEQRPG
jgi:GntR family transcriptional regulator/MocR family aminotransferase